MPLSPPLTLVTVVFEAELPLLELQARSLARFVEPASVEEIIVLDNGRRAMTAAAIESVLNGYGALRPKVRVLRPEAVARLPRTTGWYAQQVLKLMVAARISSELYVVLDAKNHLVGPLEPAFFVGPDGRLRTSRHSYLEHRLRPDLERTLRYFGADDDLVSGFTPTITPFTLRTGFAREMVADVEAMSHTTFPRVFLRERLLEFFAYAAWVATRRRRLEEEYVFDQPPSPIVWPRSADLPGTEAAVRRAEGGSSPWFSVHRRALGVLDRDATDRLARFWVDRGLFADEGAAQEFLVRAQRVVRRGERRQRRRDLVPRAARVMRRRFGRSGR